MTDNERKTLHEAVRKAIEVYAGAEEAFGDEPYLKVDPRGLTAEPVAEADVPEDEDGFDYYPLLDLVEMDPENPGVWRADEEAIQSIDC